MDRDDDREFPEGWEDVADDVRGLDGGQTGTGHRAALEQARRLAQRRPSRGPRGYRRPDERIREDLCERLFGPTGADASDVTVEVRDGEVTLLGTVPEPEDGRRIVDVATRVLGVVGVRDQLCVTASEGLPTPEPVGG